MIEDGERRTAARVKVSLKVKFAIGDGPMQDATVENVSSSGVLLVAPTAFASATRIRLAFVDTHNNKTHELTGEVVRSAPAGKFGVSFVHVGPEALAYIRTLVGSLA